MGADLLAQVDLDAVAARLARLPTAALLADLEGIVMAIDNADPARRRRRAGLFGRLVGRDLVAQAVPDPVDTRVRLHLSSAQALAQLLNTQATELEPLSVWLRAQAHRLRGLNVASPVETASDSSFARRRVHLAAVAAMWETTAAHVEMVRQHAGHLLARHAQVRDLLIPAWRQRSSLAGPTARSEVEATARLEQALRDELASLREALHKQPTATSSLHTATTPTGGYAGSATKEPST